MLEKLINHLPANLCFLRKKLDLKQEEVQQLLGFSRTTWSNYENGISEPSVNGLLIISKFFGISLNDLITTDLSANSNMKSLKINKKAAKAKTYSTKDVTVSTVKDSAPAMNYVMKELKKLRQEVDGIKKLSKKR